MKNIREKIIALYKGTEVEWQDCWMYALITLLAHPLMHIFFWAHRAIVNDLELSAPEFYKYYTTHFWVQVPAYLFLFTVVVHLLVTLMFHKMPAAHYRKTDDRSLWWKSGLLLMIPGEIVRFLLSVLPNIRIPFVSAEFMNTAFGNTFANAANLLYQIVYVMPFGVQNRAVDYAVYTLCHLVYLAGYLAVQLWIYKRLWDRAGRKPKVVKPEQVYDKY